MKQLPKNMSEIDADNTAKAQTDKKGKQDDE